METAIEYNKKLYEFDDAIEADFLASADAKSTAIRPKDGFTWEDKENLLRGRWIEGTTDKPRYIQSSGELLTICIDASNRIMAQPGTGKFIGIGDTTLEDAITANLVYHEYIIPNANTGGHFLTKARQINFLSKIYGTSVALVHHEKREGYEGSDYTVVHPRRFYPQPGKTTIADMDWCFADAYVSKSFLKAKAKDGWNSEAIAELLQTEGTTKSGTDSLTVEEYASGAYRKLFLIRHRFEKNGLWKVYIPDTKKILYSVGEYFPGLPLIEKHSIPLIDTFWDLSDFDRGETSQRNLDTFYSKFLEIVARKANPISIVDRDGIVSSTVNYDNTFWFVKPNRVNDSVRQYDVNSDGLIASLQQVQQTLKVNLMSLGATSDTSISKAQDQGFGKTPEALKMQSARESARDSADRFAQERFLEGLAEKMFALSVKRGLKEAKITHVEEAIKKISDVYGAEVGGKFADGKVMISELENKTLRYEMDEGSTMRKSDSGEKVMEVLVEVSKNPAILQSIAESGKKINWGEALKRVAIDRGISDWEKIVVDSADTNAIEGVGDPSATIPQEQPTDGEMPMIPQEQPVMPQL